jgi:N,N'-diacetyllegionaminate synthase
MSDRLPPFADRVFAPDARTLVVAEIAQAHDGSLGTAHAYVDLAARSGADAVKFQTHIAAAESSDREEWRVRFSRQDQTRYDYWKRMEFTPEQWAGLRDHAADAGLYFLSSPFSVPAVELLEQLGVPAWKVASGEVTNPPLLQAMARTGKPVLLSSGMSSLAELDAAVARVRGWSLPVAVFQCTTAYPCPPERIGLNLIGELRARYQCPVGLSDHSGTIYPSLAAVVLGARLIEAHLVLSRDAFGPDVSASLTGAEFHQLTDGVRLIESALASPVDKNAMSTEFDPLRKLFGQSLVAARDLPAGAVLGAADMSSRKPGTGIPVARRDAVVGRRLRSAVAAGQFLAADDLEGTPTI